MTLENDSHRNEESKPKCESREWHSIEGRITGVRVMECLHLGDVLEQNHDANEGSHEKSGGGKFKARCTASTNPSERETLRQKWARDL